MKDLPSAQDAYAARTQPMTGAGIEDRKSRRIANAVSDLLSGQVIDTSTMAGRSTIETAVLTAIKAIG